MYETQRATRRALVTGCAGFLGSHLSERLLDEGWEVVGVDAFTDFYARSIKQANIDGCMRHGRFRMVDDDLSVDPLDDLLDGVDTVFHLAAQAGVRGSFGATFEPYVRHNITATQRLLEAAVRRDIDRFVYASSSSVYGNAASTPTSEDAARHPVSPYGMTKVAKEELAGVYSRSHGLRTIGLRYFTAYGPRQRPDMAFSRFIDAAVSRRPITVLGDGRQMRDFTYVTDVIDATVAAGDVTTPGAHVFNVGGGSSVALIDVINMIGAMVDEPLLLDHKQPQVGDARHTAADLTLAATELAYAPKIGLEDGLAAQLEWYAGAAGAAINSLTATA
jgi:nucleoside-diphosphate-sugar epimerase